MSTRIWVPIYINFLLCMHYVYTLNQRFMEEFNKTYKEVVDLAKGLKDKIEAFDTNLINHNVTDKEKQAIIAVGLHPTSRLTEKLDDLKQIYTDGNSNLKEQICVALDRIVGKLHYIVIEKTYLDSGPNEDDKVLYEYVYDLYADLCLTDVNLEGGKRKKNKNKSKRKSKRKIKSKRKVGKSNKLTKRRNPKK